MKQLIILLVLQVFLFSSAIQKVYYTGDIFEFAENDMLKDITNVIQSKKPELEQKIKDIKEANKEKINNYKPKDMITLESAFKDNIFYPDMTYTNPDDIYDNNGKILYPKGFKFNPLDYQTLHYQMIVINGNNQEEINWLIRNNYTDNIKYKILLSDGNYQEVSKLLNQPVFYAIPKITDKFNLKYTPSVITQIGNKIEVKEICISCKEVKAK